MNARQKAMYQARAQVIKALAHPTRLLIVDELAKHELCVHDIRELVGSKLPTVSKHLAVLKNAGIVTDEKRGVQVFYSLRCPCVSQFFTCAEKVLRTAAELHMSLIKGSKSDSREQTVYIRKNCSIPASHGS